MKIIKNIFISILMVFMSFFLDSINIKAVINCGGTEYKKIPTPAAATCTVYGVSNETTSLPVFGFVCNTLTDHVGGSLFGTTYGGAQIKSITLYSGIPDEGKKIEQYTNNIQCTFGGDFTPSNPLNEGEYYIKYEWLQNQYNLFLNQTITKEEIIRFKVKASNEVIAENNSCKIEIPQNQINTRSFEVDYSCQGNAKAKYYIVSSEYAEILNEKIPKETKFGVKNLDPGVKYTVTLYYELDSVEKKTSASVVTLKDEETTTSLVTEKSPGAVKEGATLGSAKNPDKSYNIENGNIGCTTTIQDIVDEYWKYIMILAPVGLILLITFDFVKAITSSSDDQLKKSSNDALKRTIATVVLLMLPVLLKLVLGWFGIELCI